MFWSHFLNSQDQAPVHLRCYKNNVLDVESFFAVSINRNSDVEMADLWRRVPAHYVNNEWNMIISVDGEKYFCLVLDQFLGSFKAVILSNPYSPLRKKWFSNCTHFCRQRENSFLWFFSGRIQSRQALNRKLRYHAPKIIAVSAFFNDDVSNWFLTVFLTMALNKLSSTI